MSAQLIAVIHTNCKKVMKNKATVSHGPDYIFFVEGFHFRALLILQGSATFEQKHFRSTDKKQIYMTLTT